MAHKSFILTPSLHLADGASVIAEWDSLDDGTLQLRITFRDEEEQLFAFLVLAEDPARQLYRVMHAADQESFYLEDE